MRTDALQRSHPRAAWLLLITALFALPSHAGMPHVELQRLAEAHALASARTTAPTGALIRAQAARIDPRLRLPACPAAPETFSAPGQSGGSRVSVGVRCPMAPGWSIYVPVTVEMIIDVVVLAGPAERGSALTSAQLRLEPRDVAALTGNWLTDLAAAESLILRRAVAPGAVLTMAMLEQPRLVQRGQRVRMVAGHGALMVSGEGEALADAAAGERVRIRSLGSRRVIEGVVLADGRVRTDA